MHYIFDLDGTVLCSKHRQATRADGTLDLEHWKENSKPEKVLLDSYLPMAEWMRTCWKDGHTIVVCTARVMAPADHRLLLNHDLQYHVLLSRPDGCSMDDAILKEVQLRLYAQSIGESWIRFCSHVVMYDDALSVISLMQSIGINCKDANTSNRVLGLRRTA